MDPDATPVDALVEGLDPATVDRLVERFGLDPEMVEAVGGRAGVAAILAHACLDALAGGTAAGDAGIAIDPDEVEAALEARVLALAGAQPGPESTGDARGVARALWLPDGRRWRSFGDAPLGFETLDYHLSGVFEQLARHPELRLLVSRRLLATNEPEYGEVVIGEPEEPVVVRVRLPDGAYRITVGPASTLVAGPIVGEPVRLRER